MKVKCKNCKESFEFKHTDVFQRGVASGMVNSGTFARDWHLFTRCPMCKKRVDVTGRVSCDAVKDNEDPLCKCGPLYCRCEG